MKKLVHGAWCMVLGALVALATGAAMAKESVTYLDYDVSTDAFTERTESCEIVTSGTTELADDGWYAAQGDVAINGGNIKVSGSAHLILVDGAKLTVADVPRNKPAIEVLDGKALTVYGQRNGTGKLVVTGGENAAGIGSDYDDWYGGRKCGTVTVNGGMVTATGGANAAGIGGGLDGVGGTVTVNGGVVTATGKGGGKGIGAGSGVGGAKLKIRNGTVVAEGWNGFDGYSNDPDSFTFDGGNIMASSTNNEHEPIVGPQPKNSSTQNVYCVTVEGLEGSNAVSLQGLANYGTKDIVPIEGKLCLYLPKGDHRFTVGGRTYAASVSSGPTTATLVETPPAATYTVTFNMQYHGDQIASITDVASGSTVSKPNDPQSSGYVFGGWFKESGCEHEWNFETDTVTENVTLYAKWTEEEVPDEPTAPEGCAGNPWKIGWPNEADVLAWTNGTGKLIVEGTGEIRDNGGLHPSPWVGSAAAKDQFTVAEIGEGVTSIGYNAFSCCEGLTSVTIPSTVDSIGELAFWQCSALTSVTVLAAKPPTGGAGMFSDCHDGLLIYVPEDSVETYQEKWSAYKDIIVPIGYDPTAAPVVEITLPAGEGYGYVVSNLTKSVEIVAEDGTYALPIGASVGIYAVAKDGYVISEVDPLIIGEVDENTKVEDKDLPTPTVHALEGTKGNPWKIGSPNEEDVLAWIDRTTLIIEGTGKMRDFWRLGDIPWWDVHDQLTAVEIGEGVTSIGAYAFYDCSVLSSVTIPEGVTSIGDSAFSDCALTSVEIPEGVMSIDDYAFSGCALTSVKIPEGVMSIDDYAFCGCEALTGVTIPSTVTSIGYEAFYGCCSLARVEIPEGVTSIGDSAFEDCYALESVTIPSTVTSIGDYAFSCCDALTSVTVLATIPPEAGKSMFEDCHDDLLIFVPRARVGDYQAEWSAYEEIIKPSTVELALTAGEGYGYVVSNLTKSVEIVAEDGKYALPIGASVGIYAVAKDGYAISAVEPLVIEKVDESTKVEDKDLPTPTVYAPGSKNNPWKIGATDEDNVLAWIDRTTLVIAGSGEMRGFYVVEDWPWYEVAGELTAVEIRKGVTSIGDSAFRGCQKLASVEIPEGVMSIDDYAFYGCEALTGVTIPSTVKWIGDNAFEGCQKLASVTVLATIPPMGGDGMFDNCHDDLLIYVPRASVGNYRMSGWNAYAGKIQPIVYGPEGSEGNPWQIGNPNMGADVLAWVNGTTLVIAGSGEMRDFADGGAPWFGVYDQLTAVEIGEGVTSIGRYAFIECISLESVMIPEGVTSIGDEAFGYCLWLESVEIPSTVGQLGNRVFHDCCHLTSVTVRATNPPMGGDGMFDNCHDDLLIYVPRASVGNYRMSGWNAYAGKIQPIVCGPEGSEGNPWQIGNPNMGADVLAWVNGTTLVIAGSGEMRDFAVSGGPWADIGDQVTAVKIGEGVTSIGGNAFFRCALTSVETPSTVKSIGEGAFKDCDALESVEIPEGVMSIGNNAFSGCLRLMNIVIPSTVTSIGSQAFRDDRMLVSVTVQATYPPTGGDGMFDDCHGDLSIYVPEDGVETYRTTDGWRAYADDIKPIGYVPPVEITLLAGGGYRYVVSNLTTGAEIEADKDGKYALPVGACIGIYCVVEEGYAVVGPNPCVIEKVDPDTTIDPSKLPTATVIPGTELSPWKVGSPNAADVTAYVKDGSLVIAGSGAMSNFTNVAEAPWAAVADKVMAVTVEEGVTLGVNALSGMLGTTTVNGTPLSFYDMVAGARGASGSSLPEGTIPVSKTELEAAGAATLTIVDGTAYVGVSVRTNGDLTAETKSWGKVKFADTTKVGLSEDGTEIVIPVPANAEKGFMVLESKATEK